MFWLPIYSSPHAYVLDAFVVQKHMEAEEEGEVGLLEQKTETHMWRSS